MYISAALDSDMQNVTVWERLSITERKIKRVKAPWYFFIPDSAGTFFDIFGNPLTKLEFPNFKAFKDAKDRFKRIGTKLYESDISPEYKVLSRDYYNSNIPKLNITFFDIEVDYDPVIGYSSISNPYAPISAISIYHKHLDKMIVLAVPPKSGCPAIPKDMTEMATIVLFDTEKDLLFEFYNQIENSDVISGWNSDVFDVPYIYERTNIVLGKTQGNRLNFRDTRPPRYKEVMSKFGTKEQVLEISGRISIDSMELFKKFEQENRASYALEMIAEEILPDLPKLEYDNSLYHLYNNDFIHFLRYNIRDSEILKGLEQKNGYVELAIHMSHSSTGLVPNIMGTIKLAEFAVVNYCHYILNKIVPDSIYYDGSGDDSKYAGALVLPPTTGMHKNIAAIDIVSLYPSAMRSLNISPETVVGQFFENEIAFEGIYSEASKEFTLQFENGDVLTKESKEWAKWIIDNNYMISGYGTVFRQDINGVIPSILSQWFAERIEYKNKYATASESAKMAQSKEEIQKFKDYAAYCYRVQYIKKIQLNSMYGALGNKYFKFYDVRLAESTTRTGREILMHMVRKVAEQLDGNYAYPSESTIYSDTDSVYFKTHTQTNDDAIKIATIIQKGVNKSFKPFMEQCFLCKPPFSERVAAELDIIADNSIFVKKKMYIMNVFYKEGKLKNEIKIMGLSLKKTTLPKPVRKVLTKFVIELLQGADWRKLSEDIVVYKEKLRTVDNLLEIGLPKGIKKVAEYTESYMTDASAKLPGHVAAALFYNVCIEKYKDKESLPIKSGQKIKVYYLTKKFGRFKSIAVPSDTKHLPQWFLDNFSGIVDKPLQTEKLVDDTLKNILKSIDKKIPTRKLLLYMDVMSDD